MAVWLRSVRHRVGRRGAALLFFAELDLVYGLVLAFPSGASASSATNRYFATVGPLDVWAVLWIFVGLVCLWCAFQRYDRYGYNAAILLYVLWGGLALLGVWFFDVPPTAPAIWLSLAGLVWVLSGWREPHQDADDAADVTP